MLKRFPYVHVILVCLLLGASGSALAAPSTLVAVTDRNPPQLFTFLSDDPGLELGNISVRGLQSGEKILAMDFSAVDGTLYALGSTGRFYAIGTDGRATEVGSGIPISGNEFGMDFGSLTNTIRIIGADGSNVSVMPATGVQTPNTPVSYALLDVNSGTTPQVDALASILGGALYGIDRATNSLVILPVPALGLMTTIGPLGVTPGPGVGFDIADDVTAYATFPVAGLPSTAVNLYTINLLTGAATRVSRVYDSGFKVMDIAVAPAGYTLPYTPPDTSGALTPATLMLLLAGVAARRRRRA